MSDKTNATKLSKYVDVTREDERIYINSMLLTLNSNTNYEDKDFIKITDILMKNLALFIDCDKPVVRVDVEYAFETGQKYGKFHCHAKIDVISKCGRTEEANSILNCNQIRALYHAGLNKNIHCNVKTIRPDFTKKYILK